MKIFYTATSPYARIARIAADICGVGFDGVELEADQLRSADNPVLEFNCTGRVPTLVDGDVVITETRAVCRYLESIGNGTALFGYAGDWTAERFENTAMSLLDGCALWTREYRRPEDKQFPWLCDVERQRAEACLDWFNDLPAIRAGDTPWDFAHLVLAVAIDYQMLRGLIPDWRDGRDALAAWHAAQTERPVMRANPKDPNA